MPNFKEGGNLYRPANGLMRMPSDVDDSGRPTPDSDMHIKDTDNGGYADTMAQLTRNQYQDYLKRYKPVEDDLIRNATSNDLYDLQVARNSEISEANFTRVNEQQAAAQQKYGLADRRTEQQKRNLDLSRGLSLASMNNESRQAIGDLQRKIMTGAAGDTRQHVNKLRER
ncbi:hypothetical protein [Photobacterium sanguinicancri]|uniref:hypothetical protein n=1 Tax=Photobacterium sanguinicancri TaxID=875932 RepID=UPI003D0CDF95